MSSINSVEEDYQHCLAPISDEPDIYEIAQRRIQEENLRRYPPKSCVEDMTAEEQRRVELRAKVEAVVPKLLMEAACSNPTTWITIVHPSVSKQNYYEPALLDYLNNQCPELDGKFVASKIPTSGDDALFLDQGVIKRGSEYSTKKRPTKSLDILIQSLENPEIKFYCVVKRTVGAGGAQDNQYHDAMSFIKQQRSDSNVKLLLITDGDYYTRVSKEKKTKLDIIHDEITQLGISNNTGATNYLGVSKVIEEALKLE